jgi:hypothetical protein
MLPIRNATISIYAVTGHDSQGRPLFSATANRYPCFVLPVSERRKAIARANQDVDAIDAEVICDGIVPAGNDDKIVVEYDPLRMANSMNGVAEQLTMSANNFEGRVVSVELVSAGSFSSTTINVKRNAKA